MKPQQFFLFLAISLISIPMAAQAVERVSVSSHGNQSNASSKPINATESNAISGNGRFVAFISHANNLVANDTNNQPDIFVHDRFFDTTERVNVQTVPGKNKQIQANNASYDPSISNDGQFVAFESVASNLVPGDTNNVSDVFVHDRHTNITERVSINSNGVQGNRSSQHPSISGDGRFVAFSSWSNNLIIADTNYLPDIFVHDRYLDITERISVNSGGFWGGNGKSYFPSISADGRFVSFSSFASNLITGDTNANVDIFVRDRIGRTTQRVSVTTARIFESYLHFQGSGTTLGSKISDDGQFVAFWMAREGEEHFNDLFVHDRLRGISERIYMHPYYQDYTDLHEESLSISGDGRFVAFVGAKVTPPQGLGSEPTLFHDVLVYDRHNKTSKRVSTRIVWVLGKYQKIQGNSGSFYPSISDDGRLVSFLSFASNLVTNDTNNRSDVFVAHNSQTN